VRHRRIFGGAMRQVGVFAAGAAHALDHHGNQLATDHANATLLARRLSASRRIELDLATVQTNIVVFRVAADAPDAAAMVARAREKGVLLFAFGPRTLRAVTHLDVTRAQCEQAGDVLAGGRGGIMSQSAPHIVFKGTVRRAGLRRIHRAAVRPEGRRSERSGRR
jgi:threonine aldolase